MRALLLGATLMQVPKTHSFLPGLPDDLPRGGDSMLLDVVLEPHHPDTRHFVHVDERALKGTVGSLDERVVETQAADQLSVLGTLGSLLVHRELKDKPAHAHAGRRARFYRSLELLSPPSRRP